MFLILRQNYKYLVSGILSYSFKKPSNFSESSKNAPASRNVGKQLKTKYELGKHIYKTEEQPNLVACAICNKTFTSKGSLNYHIEMHKRKKIECTHCNKIFLCTRTLERHLQNKHKSMQESGTYFCASCDEMCISKKRLETHIIKNHPEQLSAAFKAIKMFPCDLCEKSYYGRKNLRNHLRAVHGGCKAQCPICKKRKWFWYCRFFFYFPKLHEQQSV